MSSSSGGRRWLRFWRSYGGPTVSIIQSLGVLFVGIGLILQYDESRTSHDVAAATLILKFDDRFSAPNLQSVIDAVNRAQGSKLLKENGGSISDSDLEQLIIDYDELNELFGKHLTDDDFIKDVFCGDVQTTYDNSEVEGHLRDLRRNDPSLWDGFDAMYLHCKAWTTPH